MKEDFVEFPDLAGKTIQSLRLYSDARQETAISIDFADGTTFSCVLTIKAQHQAQLLRGGVGEPQVLKQYLE